MSYERFLKRMMKRQRKRELEALGPCPQPIDMATPLRRFDFVRPPNNVVKQLKAQTGASSKRVNIALYVANNDVQKALEMLQSDKYPDSVMTDRRTIPGGAVMVKVDGSKATMVKLGCETPTASRTQIFRDTIKKITEKVFQRKCSLEEWQATLKADIDEASSNLKELIQLQSVIHFNHIDNPISISKYVHNTIGEDVGQIGAIIGLRSEAVNDPIKLQKYERI